MSNTQIGIGAVIIVVLAAALYFLQGGTTSPVLFPIESTGTSTGSGLSTTPSKEPRPSLADAQRYLLGSWRSASQEGIALTFDSGGSVSKQDAKGTQVGSWLLYTPETRPKDLLPLTLEPGGVFLRLTFGKVHQDFFVWEATTITLGMGPVGQGGSILFTRSK